MTGYVEIVAIAFVTQLAVLPGEKVQLMIAGLSTRYDPKIVVAAAGSAFAGWTAVEIAFGQALQSALSPVVLDSITAVLFFLFAVLLYRSAPERGTTPEAERTDGGLAAFDDLSLPGRLDKYSGSLGGFFPIFLLTATGEFGDKTQLVTIGLATQYAHGTAIWVGEMAAIIPVSLLNAFVFYRFSHRFDARKAHFAGATLFAFFGVDTLQALVTDVSVWETVVNTVSAAVTTVL